MVGGPRTEKERNNSLTRRTRNRAEDAENNMPVEISTKMLLYINMIIEIAIINDATTHSADFRVRLGMLRDLSCLCG